jgi:hypothetical protein
MSENMCDNSWFQFDTSMSNRKGGSYIPMVCQYAIARNANGSEHPWRTLLCCFYDMSCCQQRRSPSFRFGLASQPIAVPDPLGCFANLRMLSLEEAHRLA